MMKLIRLGFPFFFAMLLMATGCVDPYNPPVVRQETNYLVADAYLSTNDGTVTVSLSRTQPLYATETPPAESGAVVTLEDDQGAVYPLQEQRNGRYSTEGVVVSAAKKYRMHIRTSGKEDFFSEFVNIKPSPEIDNVYWLPESDGIFIYVDTHDPSGNSRYYKWSYAETWEYTSSFASIVKILEPGVIVPRPVDEYMYMCWRTVNSTGIFVGSSSKLQEDVIRQHPLIFIPKASVKLARKYSVLVKQQSLTEEAYNYWLQLEQTTERLGGLFDPMPSEITGNFYNATDPSQPVLGFFSGGSIVEKRMFVSFIELPRHLQETTREFCVADSIPMIDVVKHGTGTLLIDSYGMPFPEGYLTSSNSCIDCRTKGGTTVKPLFWK